MRTARDLWDEFGLANAPDRFAAFSLAIDAAHGDAADNALRVARVSIEGQRRDISEAHRLVGEALDELDGLAE